MNTSNSDNLIGTSNLTHINVQNNISFNNIILLQKVTDSDSSSGINDEITDEININEEILSHQIHQKSLTIHNITME